MGADQNPYRRLHRQAIATRDFTLAAQSLVAAAKALLCEYNGQEVLKEDIWRGPDTQFGVVDLLLEVVENLELWDEVAELLVDHTEKEFQILAGDLDED
jgi:hypothetical protein